MRILTVILFLGGWVLPASAINIVFDYTYDNGYFSGANAYRRTTLEAAAAVYEQRLISSLPALNPNPGIGNTWSLVVPRPDTGVVTSFDNMVLPEDTIVIYAGGRDLGSLGGIGYTGYSYSWGTSQWASLWQSRFSDSAFLSVGGSVSFNVNGDFYFDADPSSLEPFTQATDFYTLALHEIGHVIGFFLGDVGDEYQYNDEWIGPEALALIGNPVPLIPGEAHIEDGFLYDGLPVIMDPTFGGLRVEVSELEWAILRDMGWVVAAIPEPTTSTLGSLGLAWLVLSGRRRGR